MANAKRETKATAKTVDVEVVADSDARERAQQAVKALEEGTAEVVALVGVGSVSYTHLTLPTIYSV